MKKIFGFLLAMMILSVSLACGESADLFTQLSGKLFEFSSGVGAWGTELIMGADGAFTGNYHDGEMGEAGEGYPNGTVYGCLFHGQLSEPVQVSETAWTAKIAVEPDEGQVPETVEDGVRYVTSAPYGLDQAETVTVFLPGTPVEGLPEELLFWTHLQETDPGAAALPFFVIWSEADGAGFISMDVPALLEGEAEAQSGAEAADAPAAP